MKYIFEYFITQSLNHFIIIILIAFLESFAIIGYFIPSFVFMSTLGVLIGSGEISIYCVFLYSILGCLIGDWFSYYIGWKIQYYLYKLYFIKKYIHIFNKIKKKSYNNSFKIIFIGKFFKITRPLTSITAGILQIPLKSFFLPNTLSCIFWPIIYLIPGIYTGSMLRNTKYNNENHIFFLLISIILFIWCRIWMFLKIQKNTNNFFILNYKIIKNLSYLFFLISIIETLIIIFHSILFFI
ncbi:DedA family protein [Buchnera aphidicola (Mollitrichosiphum nigrofasciatum)]|uniref:DedA family protein n=1 Tax=Buchnera aphidicola TaxID=9 RepID=UPI0031B807BF